MSVDAKDEPPKKRTIQLPEKSFDKIFSVRLRAVEFASLYQQASELGLSVNRLLRIMIRNIGGFLELDPRLRAELSQAIVRVGEISENIARLHDAYLSSGKVKASDLASLAAQRAAFGTEFAQLDGLLRTVLNVSQRRADGRRRLEESVR